MHSELYSMLASTVGGELHSCSDDHVDLWVGEEMVLQHVSSLEAIGGNHCFDRCLRKGYDTGHKQDSQFLM